jgi:2-polyprenyl-3-methyl-5-hydroxy-6-metoxy-1,4-benzoquinol methylase
MNTSRETNSYLAEDVKARGNDLYAQTKYQIIRQWLSNGARLNILDVGCGSGELAILLAKDGHKLTGIDSESEFIDLARQNATANNLNIDFIAASLEQFHPNKQFDCVISTDVIEHIENDQSAVGKIAQMTYSDGMIIIAVPSGPWLFGHHDRSIGHYRRYSLESLKSVLKNSAEVMDARYFGWTFIPICILFSKILKKPYPLAESGDSKKSPLVSIILKIVLQIDKAIALPIGTSLIIKAKKIKNIA